MDKEEANKTTAEKVSSVYPVASRGNFSTDHSNYAKKRTWAGGDPDKNTNRFFILFMIFIGVLFIMAIKSLTGADFIF